MKMKTNDIALVVVDADSPQIEENSRVALPNIQALIDSGLVGRVVEYSSAAWRLTHHGERIDRYNSRYAEIEEQFPEGEIILVGGPLGNQHWQAFMALLNQSSENSRSPNIHIPFDCTYYSDEDYQDGDKWLVGKLGKQGLPEIESYYNTISIYGPGGIISGVDTPFESSKETLDVKFWKGWQDMVPYLQTHIATRLVNALAIEDINYVMDQYKAQLIEIGMPAVNPLQDFLATEGTQKQTEPGALVPGSENYTAARLVLETILNS
jgi:hypothetical protein